MIDEPEKTFTVFDSAQENAEVKIVKLSEAAQSTLGIKAIDTDGTISPSLEKDLLIEFIGDSITCGYGVDDEVKENHFQTSTEDATRAYAYKTAEKLGADYSLVSYSGYGIISGYTNGAKVTAQQLPKYYSDVAFSYNTFGGTQANSIDWDFSVQPDIVVINLGTNDDSYTQGDTEKSEEYSTAYTEFIKTVREKNPNAKILCTLGIMGDRLFPYVEKAVENYTAETGDTNILTMKFDVQNQADGYAADWHPTEATHEKASQKLADFINENILVKA
jgi:lysophospholipase L1-like esterase